MIFMTRIGLTSTPASSSVTLGFRAILPPATHRGGRLFYSHGFSLLELLLVLFIMGLMTATTMLMTGGVEDQNKYDETKRRMELVKRAIVGDPTRTVNGGPEISGFVADMGRLPGCLRELLEGKCTDAGSVPSTWHGPYLDVLPESSLVSGTNSYLAFRDGYGNDGDNYGWIFKLFDESDTETTTAASAVKASLHSKGQSSDAGDNYPADANYKFINGKSDFKVNLKNLIVNVNFVNTSATSSVPANETNLKLRAYFPDGNGGETYSNSDMNVALSAVPPNTSQTKTFGWTTDTWVPLGVRVVKVVCADDGKAFGGQCDDDSDISTITLVPKNQLIQTSITWSIE